MIKNTLEKLILRHNLSASEMDSAMRFIMQGDASPAQIGAFLVGLRMKGETVEEIAAAASVMRDFSTKVAVTAEHLVDIVGTGGDGSNTFNISTTAAFVIAAAGGRVAKHNNRSVSSRSGSADLLERAGVMLSLTPTQIATCICEIGIGFMFAPAHHSATRHAAVPRRELGTRTIFNLLGPLTNPAAVKKQVIGVFSREWVRPIAEVMNMLGSEHVLVVHSDDGLDELSIAAPTHVAELRHTAISEYQVLPGDFGFDYSDSSALTVRDAGESYAIVESVLDGQPGAALDVVLLNAAAGLYAADVARDLDEGIGMANAAINSGEAKARLATLAQRTRELAG